MPGKLVSRQLRGLKPLSLKLALLLALAMPGSRSMAQDLVAGLRACRSHSDTAQRLTCYDALPAKQVGTEFRGTDNFVTPPFDLKEPTMLVFDSMDAILVVYLMDASGEVVQNLHQAGAGTGEWLIRHPGRYSLQINASGGWRIRLQEP